MDRNSWVGRAAQDDEPETDEHILAREVMRGLFGDIDDMLSRLSRADVPEGVRDATRDARSVLAKARSRAAAALAAAEAAAERT